MEKYAVSACLCGKNCRYDGGNKLDETIAAFAREQGALLICPECKQPTRVNHRRDENGRKVRVCKKCGKDIDKK